jgi:hypothetical protein
MPPASTFVPNATSLQIERASFLLELFRPFTTAGRMTFRCGIPSRELSSHASMAIVKTAFLDCIGDDARVSYLI